MDKHPWRCPATDCGATNTWAVRFCEVCGAARGDGTAATPAKTKHDCWQCDRCPARTSGTITGDDGLRLCPTCHFAIRVRPFVSRPDDLCLECPGEPPHAIRVHVQEFRRLGALIAARGEG